MESVASHVTRCFDIFNCCWSICKYFWCLEHFWHFANKNLWIYQTETSPCPQHPFWQILLPSCNFNGCDVVFITINGKVIIIQNVFANTAIVLKQSFNSHSIIDKCLKVSIHLVTNQYTISHLNIYIVGFWESKGPVPNQSVFN